MTDAAEPTQAAIIVVDDDAESRDRTERALSRRYGDDYRIVATGSSQDARDRIDEFRRAGGDVALILADQWMPDTTGVELLGEIGALLPESKRALLIDWGDVATFDPVRRASALGQIDTYVVKPTIDLDEQFHLAIVDLLADWTRTHRRGFEGVRIVGDRWDPYSHGIRDALQRSRVPFGFYEAESPEGRALLDRAGVDGPLPVAILFNGAVLARPTPSELADAIGVNTAPGSDVFDVVVVGAGPAGLAAAVNGASEGLRVLVLEPEAIGGQASSSSSIRNYLGFPRGLSGSDLTARGYTQAFFFGVRFLIGRAAAGIRSGSAGLELVLDDGSAVETRAVIVATGVIHRRLGLPSLDAFTGRGVFYGGAVTEAAGMADEDVFVVGGGNSAAESALYLARFARRATLLVRGPSLAETSDYLIQEIERNDRTAVRLNTSIVDARGDYRLHSITVRDSQTGETSELDATGVFMHIGARPQTDWLPDSIERDERGYVRTGGSVSATGQDQPRESLETSLPGVFAVGDVRDGSLKRVAAAVGEGSTVIHQVHAYLDRVRRLAPAGA